MAPELNLRGFAFGLVEGAVPQLALPVGTKRKELAVSETDDCVLPSRRHLRHALAIDRLDARGDDDTRDRVGDERVAELLEAVTTERIEL